MPGESPNSFQILMASFKLFENATESPPEFNVVLVELLIRTCKICRFNQFPDRLPTVIKLTVALSVTYFRQTVPRSNLALSKQSLSYDLLQEPQNTLFTKMAGKHIQVFSETSFTACSKGLINENTG